VFFNAEIPETLDNNYELVYNAKYLVKRCSFKNRELLGVDELLRDRGGDRSSGR
jgi:hypothetical protein